MSHFNTVNVEYNVHKCTLYNFCTSCNCFPLLQSLTLYKLYKILKLFYMYQWITKKHALLTTPESVISMANSAVDWQNSQNMTQNCFLWVSDADNKPYKTAYYHKHCFSTKRRADKILQIFLEIHCTNCSAM